MGSNPACPKVDSVPVICSESHDGIMSTRALWYANMLFCDGGTRQPKVAGRMATVLGLRFVKDAKTDVLVNRRRQSTGSVEVSRWQGVSQWFPTLARTLL